MMSLEHHTGLMDELLIPLGILLIIFGLLWILFSRSVLHVNIDDHGVHVRFAPFHSKPRSFAWHDIERIIVRTVNPFGEFGGWGIRWNFSKTTGYVWRGKTGIDLRMRDGRRIVVTIEDIGAASRVIEAVKPTVVEFEQRIADPRG
jgi:hypothetical protein